jgi:hypothetical protein
VFTHGYVSLKKQGVCMPSSYLQLPGQSRGGEGCREERGGDRRDEKEVLRIKAGL